MRVCHPVILASAGTASFCLIIAAESHDKAWGTKKCIYIKHQQKNTQTTRSDHCPGFSCCMLTTQGCGGNPGFYRSFSWVNKTPKHKPRVKTTRIKKPYSQKERAIHCACVSAPAAFTQQKPQHPCKHGTGPCVQGASRGTAASRTARGAAPVGFAQLFLLPLPSGHKCRVCSHATGVCLGSVEPAQGRPSLELMASLFPAKYVFYTDIFVQRLNLACVMFS